MKFLELYKSGQCDAEAIHDFINEWHESDDSVEDHLHTYLGMTLSQYGKWVETDIIDIGAS